MPIFIGPQFSARYSSPGLAYRAPLLNGVEGTAQTIALMRQLVDEALSDAQFVRKAIDIVRTTVPAFDELGEVHALYQWVRRTIRYTKDPVTKEKLTPPQELLKLRAGDCDDISMLLAAFLLAIGYPARWITIAANAQSPEEFSHIYTEAEVPAGSKNWIPLDGARLDAEFGKEPPMYYRKRAWAVVEDSYEDLSGSRRRLPKFLSGYATVNGMGQDGIDWQPIVQQSISEIPTIIAATSGKGSSATTPYGSFQTSYTPGYGIPAAGYTGYGTSYQSPVGFSLGASGFMPLLIFGGILLLAMGRRS